jgi:serine protease AprX
MVLLTCSAMPSYAGTKASATPNSVVWGSGKNPVPPPTSINVTTTNSSAAAAARKFAPEFQESLASGDSNSNMVTVLVQYRHMPQSAALSSIRVRGAAVQAKLQVIRAVKMRVPASMLQELAQDPNVLYVTPDRPVSLTSSNEDYAGAVQADLAASQYAFDGTGIGVAVIDSGVSDHPDLHNAAGASRVVYSQSFVAGNTSTADQYGHGTHVAGLIGGNGASSGTGNGYSWKFTGTAPNVNIINLRVLDQNGAGTDSQVIAAIQQAIALKNTYNIRVINMSLGRPVFESYTLDPVCQAVESAWKAGIVVVVAAGNNGRDNSLGTHGWATIGVPAVDPAVITVGATRTKNTATRVDDSIASYSSRGPSLIDHIVKPDLVAPGNRLVSLRAAGSKLDTMYASDEISSTNGKGTQYFRLSGTSMATPVVSGAVALMLQKNSALTPDQVKARLMKTAWKGFGQYTSSVDTTGNTYSNQYDVFTYGAGYLDISAALGNTDLATGTALSPTAVFNSTTGTVTIVNTSNTNFNGVSVVWGGTSVVWGNSVVWGANTVLANSVVWGGTSVVWGSTSITGNSVVWGATTTTVQSMSAFSDGEDGED